VDSLISKDDLRWTVTNLNRSVLQLDRDERLLVAFQSITAERFAHSPSMSLLTLWSGMEALFAIDREQTFRLSLMAAYYLENENAPREKLFEQMRDAYKVRSAVTHGRKKDKGAMVESIDFVASVLRRCLLRAFETQQLPTTKGLFFS
jgi:hypothetical protein